MFILVNPNTNVIIKITETCIPIINNKGINIETEDGKATSYLLDDNLIYPKKLPSQMYKVDNIPSEVIPYKYLYTEEDGFIINENYEEPEDIGSDVENIEEEVINIKNNIADLDKYNIKTDKSKILDTYLYLGNNEYYINNEANSRFNEVRVNMLNLGESGSGYYLNSQGSANLNEVSIAGQLTLQKHLQFSHSLCYINNAGEAHLKSLELFTDATINGKTNFGSSGTYYIDSDGIGYVYQLGAENLSIYNNLIAENATINSTITTDSITTDTIYSSDFLLYNKIGNSYTAIIQTGTMVSAVNGSSEYYTQFGSNLAQNNIIGSTLELNSTNSLNMYSKYVYIGSTTDIDLLANNINVNATTNTHFSANNINISSYQNNVIISAANEIRLACNGITGDYNDRCCIHFDYTNNAAVFRPTVDYEVYLGSGSYRWHSFYTHDASIDGNLYFASPFSEIRVGNNAAGETGTITLMAQFNLGYDYSPSTNRKYYLNSAGNGSFNAVWAEAIAIKGDLVSTSSRRFKDNIIYRDNDYWHDRLMQLKPCTFNYKKEDNIKHAGLIAEDVQEILPEFINFDEDGNCDGIKMLDLIPLLISEVQRLNSIINNK